MTVLGGCEESQRPYLETVLAAAAGLPVTITPNAPRAVVERAMSTASIFWSATGLGEDEEAAPWSQEHFGMTTAEAMAGGCVPVVIDRAGQREIVREGERRVPLGDAGRADGEDRAGRHRRVAARPVVGGRGPPGAGLLRRGVRHPVAYGFRHPRPS